MAEIRDQEMSAKAKLAWRCAEIQASVELRLAVAEMAAIGRAIAPEAAKRLGAIWAQRLAAKMLQRMDTAQLTWWLSVCTSPHFSGAATQMMAANQEVLVELSTDPALWRMVEGG